MPCGVETTQKIAAILRSSDRPVTLIEIMKTLSIKRTAAMDGIRNLLDTGSPIVATQVRIPGRKGRPEYGFALRGSEVPVYWGPNPHRVQSFGQP